LRVLDALLRHGMTRAKIEVFPSFRGALTGPRKARPGGTNPESSNLLWIPGSSLRDAPE
jgi:hypothetical protein